jgi:hypothetical protein
MMKTVSISKNSVNFYQTIQHPRKHISHLQRIVHFLQFPWFLLWDWVWQVWNDWKKMLAVIIQRKRLPVFIFVHL